MNCFMIAAVSVDGFIAQNAEQKSTAWTSKEDSKWFWKRTKQAGVVVMGSTTFATTKQGLPGRLNIVYSSKTPPTPLPENVRFTQLEPAELLSSLEAEGYQEVAICGGSSLYSQFLASGVVQKIYLTVEPVVLGSGIKLFGAEVQAKLKLVSTQLLNDSTIVLEYDVISANRQ